jgi:DNA invertase Pin-like site-specific DNA recombinase
MGGDADSVGGLAEFERELIRARTGEGRKRAQARGVRFGRKPKLTMHQRQEALARRANGEALVEIASSYAVSHSTISRLHAGQSMTYSAGLFFVEAFDSSP